jgi:hypothetical protein
VSRYRERPLDLRRVRTVPLKTRGGKVRIADFGRPHRGGLGGWLDSLPKLLAADSLRAVVAALDRARRDDRMILWGLGGHVIKCGLAPVFIDMMSRGYARAFAMNGAAAIHDLEIALAGHTSEDVETVLPDGGFGAAEETGRIVNEAFIEAARDGIGAGEAIGCKAAGGEFASSSLMAAAYQAGVAAMVHVAIGTDTPHMHPAVDPAAMGVATHHDFRLMCELVRRLDGGGVYLNVGSAVIMPEVFLKAVSAVRNLGNRLENFTTVNFDFLQHYRPRVNVVERPHAGAGGRGFALTGHHEIMIPLLAALLAEGDA